MKAPEHIGEDETKRVLAYVTVIRDKMRMNNWDIVLMEEPCEKDAHASMCAFSNNHHVGNLCLSEKWHDLDNVTKANTLIHELVHLQHRDLNCHWQACVDNNSGISEDEVQDWGDDFDMFLERFVCWVANMLTPHMPAYPVKSTRVGEGVSLQPH